MAGGAHGVPTVPVVPLVAGDVIRQRVQRPVRRRVGHVQEERRRRGGRLRHHRHGVIADGVGEVIGLRLGGGVDEPVVAHHVGRVEVAAATAGHAVMGVEAALHRQRMVRRAGPPGLGAVGLVAAADVPLARHHGPVAAALQRLGDRDAVAAQVALVLRDAVVAGHVADPRLVRVQPGEQRGARRTAARAVVRLREAQPRPRQRVQVRRGDLRTVASDVGIPQVVRQDHHEVGPPPRTPVRSLHHAAEPKSLRPRAQADPHGYFLVDRNYLMGIFGITGKYS